MRPRAKQLRQIARKNQNKHYWWAVLVTLVAMVLGCAAYSVPSLPVNFNFEVTLPNSTVYQYNFSPLAQLSEYLPLISALATIVVIYCLIIIFVAGPTRWGYVRYCLQMHDGDCQRPFATLFSGWRRFGKLLGLYLFIALKTFLWALIMLAPILVGSIIISIQLTSMVIWNSVAGFSPVTLIPAILLMTLGTIACSIPAIRAALSYSQSFYLMVENPDLPVTACVRCSIQLMRGHKGRLFCLDLSFIGWRILNVLTLGILGILFINPYQEFAHAAFYRDLVPMHPASRLWEAAPSPRPNTPAQPNPNPPFVSPAAPSQPSASPMPQQPPVPGALPSNPTAPQSWQPPVEQNSDRPVPPEQQP